MARQSLYQYKREGILQAIQSLTTSTGRSPSLREIADVANVSVATLHAYLKKMQDEGVVAWDSNKHRSLKVIGSNPTGSGLGMSLLSVSQP